jgi:predicted dithiol-disulfide oxidoreductase (DUF899 family)
MIATPLSRWPKTQSYAGSCLNGTVTLLDLFEGRRQLVMHHFMWSNDIDADGKEHPQHGLL